MKRIIYFILTLCLLAGCAGQTDITPSPTSSPTPVPSPSPTPESISETIDWPGIYGSFLENTELPPPLSYGVMAVGLCDLDFDDVPELILFDQGASAAYGVHFYDIDAEGNVVYVSGSADAEPTSTLTVSANSAEDFHLLRMPDGSKMFYCDSGNGNDQFLFRACIAFERGETLELREVGWWTGDYDEATGQYLPTEYRAEGASAGQAEYEAALDAFFAGTEELPCPLSLVRLFDGDYSYDKAGLLAMYDDARAGFIPEEK